MRFCPAAPVLELASCAQVQSRHERVLVPRRRDRHGSLVNRVDGHLPVPSIGSPHRLRSSSTKPGGISGSVRSPQALHFGQGMPAAPQLRASGPSPVLMLLADPTAAVAAPANHMRRFGHHRYPIIGTGVVFQLKSGRTKRGSRSDIFG
jgi:hypothetical protein